MQAPPGAGSAASTAAQEALCEPTAAVPPPPAAVPLLGSWELSWGWQCRQHYRQHYRPGGPRWAYSGSAAAPAAVPLLRNGSQADGAIGRRNEECSGTTARSGGSTAAVELKPPQRFTGGGDYKRRVYPSFVFKALAQVSSLSSINEPKLKTS